MSERLRRQKSRVRDIPILLCCGMLLLSACSSVAKATQPSSPLSTQTQVPQQPTSSIPPPPNTFFDDFNYTSQHQMIANGWVIRSKSGGPGSPDFTWSPNSIAFADDLQQPGNKLIQLTASTDGTNAKTQEAHICHVRNYGDGTYAARVDFSDLSIPGPINDNAVETFYTISAPQSSTNYYSELDNEYLPNGGWDGPSPALYMNTWRTETDRLSKLLLGGLSGWHTILMQVANGAVTYYLDNQMIVSQGGAYFPRSSMSINFSLWFATLASSSVGVARKYVESVDWVYFVGQKTLTQSQVMAAIANMRQANVSFVNSVAAWPPNLASPCDF